MDEKYPAIIRTNSQLSGGNGNIKWEVRKMKRIQLSDGQPTDIRKVDESNEVVELTNHIIQVCKESGLSYVDVNKALYLADKELYLKTIYRSINR